MTQDGISVGSYEVKFFLHPNKVLNADHELVQDLGNAFQTSKYKQMAIQLWTRMTELFTVKAGSFVTGKRKDKQHTN